MSDNSPRRYGVDRREFVKAAVAIGGGSALSACLGREDAPELPQGTDDPSALPERQHAWKRALSTDDAGNTRPPRHRILLLLDYAKAGTPSSADRRRFERSLRGLERAYPRSNEGLLFSVSYSPSYFDRFEEPLPNSVDLPAPEALASFEDPELDTPDAVVHLASDYGSVVLAAERALTGEQSTLNGVDLSTSLDGLAEVADRRTGFVGEGLPADNQDVSGIPDSDPVSEDAPLYMGFESNFEDSQASEDRVTIETGPFAGGTTQHLSHIRLFLDQWYEQDSRDHRVATMFCPAHAENDRVEGAGDNLGTSTGIEDCPDAEADAREQGVVGHSQKMASAREGDSPVILRRDFDTTDDDQAGVHFLSLQEGISKFVETREAMNGSDLSESSAVGQRTNNGILQYLSVVRRGNYLVPPRSHRSLPTPRPT